MASINKVILIGNLGRDPEVRTFPDGGTICNVTMATTRKWKDKQTHEMREETEWSRIVFHGRLAEIAGEYLRKGRSAYVEGRLKTREWTDKDGIKKYTTEIVAENLQLLDSRDSSERPAERPASRPAERPRGGSGFDDMDDDIPF